MASQGWLCRRVTCGLRNQPRAKKCLGCGALRPKRRVPEHKKALRDYDHSFYLVVNATIHGVQDECAICGREPSPDRRLDRDHDHTRGFPWSGKPRGLTCVSCNILMPPKLTARKAREIADYLGRVEAHYAEEAA